MKKVFLTFAGERKDVSHLVSAKSIRLSSSLCGSTNKSTIDSLSFSLEYTRDKSLKALFFNSQKIWVEVFNPDGSPFFTGYIPDGISQVLDGLGEVISLEAYDNSWRLDMDCLDFVAERCRVCDPDNPENSIVHRLLLAAGYAQSELDLTLPVDTELRVVAAEAGDSTWREILDNLLSEYGAVIFFDAAGKATLREWYPTDTNSAVVVNEHSISADGVTRTKAEKEYNAVTVEWSNVRDTADPGQTGKENLYIASLNYQPKTNGEGETGTQISKGFYWPTSVYSDTEEVWQSYNIDDVLNYTDVTNDKELFRKRSQNKNLSLLYSYDHELSIRDQSQPDPDQWGTVLTILHKEFKFKKARILLKNETDDVVDLYRLNVRAHAVFRYNKNEQTSFFVDEVTGDRLEDETRSHTYTSKYIYDSEPAEALAARLRRQKQFGAFEYEFSSIAELSPGTVISLTQKDEFDTFAVVTKAEVEDENPMVKYTAQGLTAYLGDVSTGVSGEPSAPPWQDKVDQIKPEIEGDIFGPDAVFGDTTAVPVMVVQAQFHANLIRVLGFTDGKSEEMRPLSGLINLAGVQYQCRKVGGEWGNLVTFSAGETPQTPGGWTFDDSANRVHWYSFGVDAGGSAVAYPLEYRVRLVMSSGDVSQWSAVQSSTASVIENGDIAAHSITANNLFVGDLLADGATAGSVSTKAILVDNSGFWAAKNTPYEYTDPTSGKKKTYNASPGEFFIGNTPDVNDESVNSEFLHFFPGDGFFLKIKNFIVKGLATIIQGVFRVKRSGSTDAESFFIVNPESSSDAETGTSPKTVLIKNGNLKIQNGSLIVDVDFQANGGIFVSLGAQTFLCNDANIQNIETNTLHATESATFDDVVTVGSVVINKDRRGIVNAKDGINCYKSSSNWARLGIQEGSNPYTKDVGWTCIGCAIGGTGLYRRDPKLYANGEKRRFVTDLPNWT